jgi:hypothetical protein
MALKVPLEQARRIHQTALVAQQMSAFGKLENRLVEHLPLLASYAVHNLHALQGQKTAQGY